MRSGRSRSIYCGVPRCGLPASGYCQTDSLMVCRFHAGLHQGKGHEIFLRRCDLCDGHGRVHSQYAGPDPGGRWLRCPKCFGTRFLPEKRVSTQRTEAGETELERNIQEVAGKAETEREAEQATRMAEWKSAQAREDQESAEKKRRDREAARKADAERRAREAQNKAEEERGQERRRRNRGLEKGRRRPDMTVRHNQLNVESQARWEKRTKAVVHSTHSTCFGGGCWWGGSHLAVSLSVRHG